VSVCVILPPNLVLDQEDSEKDTSPCTLFILSYCCLRGVLVFGLMLDIGLCVGKRCVKIELYRLQVYVCK